MICGIGNGALLCERTKLTSQFIRYGRIRLDQIRLALPAITWLVDPAAFYSSSLLSLRQSTSFVHYPLCTCGDLWELSQVGNPSWLSAYIVVAQYAES